MGHIKKSLQNRVKPPHQLLPRVPGHGCSQGAPHGAADRLRDAGKRMLSPSPRVFGLRRCAQPVVHGFHRGSGVDGVGPSGLQPLLSPCTHRVPPGASTGWPLAPAPARTWWGEALSLLCAGTVAPVLTLSNPDTSRNRAPARAGLHGPAREEGLRGLDRPVLLVFLWWPQGWPRSLGTPSQQIWGLPKLLLAASASWVKIQSPPHPCNPK